MNKKHLFVLTALLIGISSCKDTKKEQEELERTLDQIETVEQEIDNTLEEVEVKAEEAELAIKELDSL